MDDRITIDFETKCELSIGDVGAWAYSVHESCDIIVLSYKIPGSGVQRWTPCMDEAPYDLFEAIHNLDRLKLGLEPYFVEAHNSFFELCIWYNVGVAKYDWPELPKSRMKCSAAKAAMHALPRALGDAGKALGLKIQKDKIGTLLIKKLSQPQKPTKKDPRVWILPDQTEPVKLSKDEFKTPAELFEMFYEYCDMDVESEEELSATIDDLPPKEREIWLLDQKINWRGIYVDMELVESALYLLEKIEKEVNGSISTLTNGYVDRPTQGAAIQFECWLEGVDLPNTQAATIEATLADESLPAKVRKLLRLRQVGSRASTKKFAKFKLTADPDDHRCRGTLMYHGASTGRWAGKGIQPQNLPRGSFKSMDEIEECISLIKERSLEKFKQRYDDPADALSSVVRSIIMATPGHELFCADYSAIEARVLVWMAGDKAALKLFHEGKDIYIDMALTIFGITLEEYNESDETQQHYMRSVGKDAILGLGYGMGWKRYKREALQKGGRELSSDFCQGVVDKYRDKYSSVVKLWNKYEAAAIHAVKHRRTKDRPCRYGRTAWYMKGRFLVCELPSGRCLHYYRPRLGQYEWYGETKDKLFFWGVHSKTKKFTEMDTYGGHLVENVCQAVARDIMSYAALDAEAAGYKILTSIHDELVAERPIGTGSVEEYEKLLTQPQDWSAGCPIDAEGWKGPRYKK